MHCQFSHLINLAAIIILCLPFHSVNFMPDYLTQRASGILVHFTSLPSPFGIGDIGNSAHTFLRFLKNSGQHVWQFLPTTPTSPAFDNSPYMSTSAFAGSALLISPEQLVQDGFLLEDDIQSSTDWSQYATDYEKVSEFKAALLEKAFRKFSVKDTPFLTFIKTTPWLKEYALFMALKDEYNQKAWFDWPEPIASRKSSALKEKTKQHAARIHYYCFEQYLFFSQWQLLRKKAAEKKIRLVGDLPIYVGWDSVDVWANQSIFSLNTKSHKPTQVAGVPPDYFSKTGQRWGNPLYRWNCRDKKVKNDLNTWWSNRFAAIFKMVDTVRVDHFRGFEAYWAIPASHKTAVKGKWIKGPGLPFFNQIKKNLGKLDIIAEDLGEITPAVIKLRDTLGFPGMKILQFAFDENRDNPFLPYNFSNQNSVIYTGTHDNDTTVGWFLSDQLTDSKRKRIKQFCNRSLLDNNGIHKDLIYLGLSSSSRLAVFPLQDVLGFGNDCKMNSPGSKDGNWTWRCAPRFLNKEISDWLAAQTKLFGRD